MGKFLPAPCPDSTPTLSLPNTTTTTYSPISPGKPGLAKKPDHYKNTVYILSARLLIPVGFLVDFAMFQLVCVFLYNRDILCFVFECTRTNRD